MVDSVTSLSSLPTELLAKIAGEIIGDSYPGYEFDGPIPPFSPLQLVLQDLEKNPRLASFVQKLSFSDPPGSMELGLWGGAAQLARLKRLVSLCPNLKVLEVCFHGDNPSESDQDLLDMVEACRSLEELYLQHCHEITSQGLREALPFLKNLRKLSLFDLAVTNSGVSFFRKSATNLAYLDLEEYLEAGESGVEDGDWDGEDGNWGGEDSDWVEDTD
ncbi:hypothetical protein DFS34DRAFT_591660 [Phlyctochytrium arcticum]|nr:hypothetical protein DFS34DRAFT_591660 [Phlyctochytrium arcticum]